MAQASDRTVDDGTGIAVRSDINARFHALFTNHSGDTDTPMVEKYAYQFWADTTANQLKIRNSGNNAWIPLRGLSDGAVEASTTLPIKIGGTTRMSIGGTLASGDGGPSVFIKTSANPFSSNDLNNEGAQFTQRGRLNIGINDAHCIGLNRWGGTGGPYVVFAYDGGQLPGSSISTNTTSVAYNTGSDYRLKENIAPLTGAKARVNQLQVHRFNFTKDPSTIVDGFIAHEAQAVVPEAVTGHKDEVDANGDPVYQGIDQAKFVPLLAAALQEAYAEIAALTARVEALEAA